MPPIALNVDWVALDLNVQKLGEDWNRPGTRDDFRRWLSDRSRGVLEDICRRNSVDVADDDTKLDVATKLIDAFALNDLFLLKAFYRGKALAIKEYVAASDSATCTDLREGPVFPFSSLVTLALESIDHLHGIDILYRWITYPSGQRLSVPEAFTPADVDRLSDALDDLTARLDLRAEEVGSAAYVEGVRRIGAQTYVALYRQTADRHLREVDGRRRSRPTGLALIRLADGEDTLEIRNAATFAEPIREWADAVVGPLTLVDAGLFQDFDPESFKAALFTPLSPPHDTRLTLTRLTARASMTIGQAQIAVSARDLKSDIRPDLRDLVVEESLLKVGEPSDIDSLDLTFEGRSVTVAIDLKKDDLTCRAVSIDRNLPDRQRAAFADAFEESTGFPLDRPIARGDTPINRWWAYDQILGLVPGALQLPQAAIFKDELLDLGLIEETPAYVYQCANQHIGNAQEAPDQCEVCGSDELDARPSPTIDVDRQRLEQLVLGAIAATQDVEVVNPGITRTIDGAHRQLALLDVGDQSTYVYFAYDSVGKRFLKFFELTQSPLVIIRVGTEGTTSRLVEHSLFAEVPAGRVVERTVEEGGPAAPVELTRALHSRKGIALELRERAARHSREQLALALQNPVAGYADTFELDTYNLFTFWLESAERWGKALTGRALPEAVGGWHIRIGDAPPRGYSIAWDCKWTATANGYDLEISEKRKAKEYIKKLTEQWYLQTFSQGLSVYALVSNNFRDGQLENFAAQCKAADQNWHGQVAFIDATAVVSLHMAWIDHYHDLLSRIGFLRERLTDLLLGEGQPYVRITEADVIDLLDQVLQAPEAAPILKVRGIRRELVGA